MAVSVALALGAQAITLAQAGTRIEFHQRCVNRKAENHG